MATGGEQEQESRARDPAGIEKAAELLGGARVLRRRLRDPFDVHEALSQGLPRAALRHLIAHELAHCSQSLLAPALGMSVRTLQRFKVASDRPLNKEQSGRMWVLAEILAKAGEVFGSEDAAVEWLGRPAVGLDRRRPIDLLATPAGVRLIEEFLGRLEYGVYA